jgi:hypothetical protein
LSRAQKKPADVDHPPAFKVRCNGAGGVDVGAVTIGIA